MAQVYLGRMVASAGFSRLVAIKRLHETLGTDREFVAMLLDEARLTAQIRHTNVVDTLDLVVRDGAFALVLEWVEGEALNTLLKRASTNGKPVPRPIALAIMQGVLRGLVAAHEARGEDGQPLGIVHRDVSPQNVLVGVDGIPRIIDFGVAKAIGKLEATRPGEIRGKYGYMAPEHLMGRPVTRQVDVYAAGVMLWELLTGMRLFKGDDERVVCAAVLRGDIPRPSTVNADVPPELDAVVLRATARETGSRYFDAREMLTALEPLGRASEDEVGAWVRALAAETIEAHQKMIQAAATPAAARSIDELLQELGAPSSVPAQPRASGHAFPPEPTPRSRTLPAAAEVWSAPVSPSPSLPGPLLDAHPRSMRWLTAMAAFVTLALIGLVLGLLSLAGSATKTPASIAPPPEPLVATSAVLAGPGARGAQTASAAVSAAAAAPPPPPPPPALEVSAAPTASPPRASVRRPAAKATPSTAPSQNGALRR